MGRQTPGRTARPALPWCALLWALPAAFVLEGPLRVGERGESVVDRDQKMRQAVVVVEVLGGGHHLVAVEKPFERLIVDAAFEFRVAEIDDAVEHGGKGLLKERVPTQKRFCAL